MLGRFKRLAQEITTDAYRQYNATPPTNKVKHEMAAINRNSAYRPVLRL